eukprot:6476799-Amphidinium_carterae.1
MTLHQKARYGIYNMQCSRSRLHAMHRLEIGLRSQVALDVASKTVSAALSCNGKVPSIAGHEVVQALTALLYRSG